MISVGGIKEHYLRSRSDLSDLDLWKLFTIPIALPRGVRRFLNERTTVPRAEEEIRRLLDDRERRFLELVRQRIYGRPTSPYLRLLKIAGCEFSDLWDHTHRYGLEPTLDRLAREGVYLTSEEFKGKKDVVRGAQSFRVSQGDFQRAEVSAGFATQSSGTSNRPVPLFISLDWLAVRTLTMAVFFSAHDLFRYSHVMYDAILPGSAVNHLLINAKLGKPTDRWFARKIPTTNWLAHTYFYLTTYLLVLTGKWFGPGFPKPEFIDLPEIRSIVRWISEQNHQGKNSFVITVASSAARIARAAWDMGVSLEGTKFSVAGEPFTKAKEEVINKVGATATTRYAYGGGLNVGFGCGNPLYRDEIHVNQHMLALISNPRSPVSGSAIHPFLCSTLHPMAPRLLLNVENGDYATMMNRDCGCPLEKVGFTQHLHTIRSFEKFTSEGMNYFGTDLFEVLEKKMPSEFGGGPSDYQLIEEEDHSGQTRLTLLVHPEVGELDGQRLLTALQEYLSQGSRGNSFMAKVWQVAGTLRVRREAPHASLRGKILPLHIRH